MYNYEVKTKQGYLITRKSNKLYTHCGVVSIGDGIIEYTFADSFKKASNRSNATARLLKRWNGKDHTVDVYPVIIK